MRLFDPVYYTYALEYDRKMEEAYTAKAHAFIVLVGRADQNKLKNAKVEIFKALEINQHNRQALDLLTIVNERINSGSEISYGKVEISLKKKAGGFSSENLLLD